jgi:hypothetical protein
MLGTEQKDKEERRLKKVKIGLMRNPKFALWSGIMMVGKTHVSETFPTACTDGRNEIYGREFIRSLDDKELGFVILHENLHKAFRHLYTWRKLRDIDARLTNYACDYVINLMLVNMDTNNSFISMPHKDGKMMGLYDKRFEGMHTKQVFDILRKEKRSDGEGGEGEGDGDGEGGFDEHDWDGADKLSDEDKKILDRDIDRALRQGQINDRKLNGNGAGGTNRELGDLLNPKVDWREVLREFVKSICNNKDTSSWRRVNRRFLSGDIYMPSLIGECVGRIVVGVDTSGSIGGTELNKFLSEVQSIANDVAPEKVDLIYWDSRVAAHEEYAGSTLSNIVSTTKPNGGGGTDPTCVIDYLKEKAIKPECIIMLTDGYISNWGDDWNAPILWVVVGNAGCYAPVGKTIHVED